MKSFIGLLFGVFVALMIAGIAGESPGHILSVILKSAFGSPYDLGLTLFYSTSLVFTGLSVCIAFHAGLFNIGAEGQLNIGAFTMAVVALLCPQLPAFVGPLFAIFCGVVAAALWGAIPGYLKAKKGSHEVIVTMMMNFISAGITSYFVVGFFKNPNSQNPETAEIGKQYFLRDIDPLHRLTSDSPLNFSILIAVILAVFIWVFLYKTVWGFELRTVGQNEEVASVSGMSPKFYKIFALSAAGAIAGLVGLNEVLASAGKFRLGFSADYGFVGIAVALLAKNRPIYILASAFLFGALQKGAADLDFETTYITKDFAKILQAIIIVSVAGFSAIQFSENFFVKSFNQILKGKRWPKKK